MKLLQLTLRVPWPPLDGGSQAMLHLALALRQAGCPLTVAALNTSKHPAPPDALDRLAPAWATDIDTAIRPLAALRSLLAGSRPYNVERFWSEAHARRLAAHVAANRPDLILCEGLYLALYLDAMRRAAPGVPVVLRAHNVEFRIWERYAAAEAPGPRRWYVGHLARRGQHYERQQLPRFDGVLAFTAADAAQFRALGYGGPLAVLPPGIDLPDLLPGSPPVPLRLGFLGSLDWLPNVQGLDWFLDAVWPRVRALVPQAEFHVAGRNPPAALLARRDPGLRVVGGVPEAGPFLAGCQVLVVPLLSGSGIRMKILEGMAWGKAVVTTPIGAEGIDAPEGDCLQRADTPDAFARACAALLTDAAAAARQGQAARTWVSDHFSWAALVPRYLDFFRCVAP